MTRLLPPAPLLSLLISYLLPLTSAAVAFAAAPAAAAAASSVCEKRDGDCPSCPLAHPLSPVAKVGLSGEPALVASATRVDDILRNASEAGGKDLQRFDDPKTGLHTSLFYFCCHSLGDLGTMHDAFAAWKWSSFTIDYADFACNLDHDNETVYLHALPSPDSQNALFNWARAVEAQMAAFGVTINHPRRSKFHMTLARVTPDYPTDKVVAALRGTQFGTHRLCSFTFAGKTYTASDCVPAPSPTAARSTAPPPLATKFDVRDAAPAPNCKFVPARPLPDLPAALPADLAAAFDKAATLIDASVNPTSIPSVVAAVAYKGKIIFHHGAGVTNRTDPAKPAPTVDTQYRIGSVSKVFPVLQAYMLADRGIVSLDDALADLDGGNRVTFVSPYGSKQQPTLRELASQRAGLPREAPCDRPLLCNLTSAEMRARINNTTPLIQEPGGTPSYSNMAFALLGRELTPVAAEADGDTTAWEQWTQRNILDPLKLTATGFGLDLTGANPSAAVGSRPDGTDVGTYHLGWSAPAGGMRSSVRDLSTLASALMDGGKPLLESRGLAQELVDPVFVDHAGGTLFGTPWEMQFHNETGVLVRRKGGNVPGYAALLAFVPEMHLSLSMLWAGDADEFSASVAAFDTVLPPMLAWLQGAEAVQPQPTNAAAFVGNWTVKGKDPTVPSNGAQIFQHQGMLIVKINLLGVGMYLRVPAAQWPHGNSSVLQLWVPRTLAPCLIFELQALVLQYLVFDETLSSFTLEGYVPGYVWERA